MNIKYYYFFTFLFISFLQCYSSDRYIDTIHYKKIYTQPVLDTFNAGWYARNLICSDSLNCAAFLDKGGACERIITTTDGGYTWNAVMEGDIDSPFSHVSASFLNKDSIFLCLKYYVYDRRNLRTTDGGKTWDTLTYTINCDTFFINTFDFLKNGIGFGSASIESYSGAKVSAFSKDFGLTWLPIKGSNFQYTYKWLIFSENRYGIMGGNNRHYKDSLLYIVRHLCLTEDNGKLFVLWEFNDTWVNDCFIDSLMGWVVCSRLIDSISPACKDIIKWTIDGGKSWVTQLDTLIPPYDNGLCSISFADCLTGGAIGRSGKLWLTKDAGNHWTADSSAPFWGKSKLTRNDIYIQYLTPKKFLVLLNDTGEIWMYNEDGFGETGIDEKPKESAISIKPNPAENYCEIEFELEQFGGYTISILDLQGNTLKKFTEDDCAGGKFTRTIDLSELAAGQYFCRVEAGGKSHSEKFVITR